MHAHESMSMLTPSQHLETAERLDKCHAHNGLNERSAGVLRMRDVSAGRRGRGRWDPECAGGEGLRRRGGVDHPPPRPEIGAGAPDVPRREYEGIVWLP